MDFLRKDRMRIEFERFVASHGDGLLKTGYLITSDLSEAEDLVQDCLLRVARRWPKVRAMEHQGAYARRILVNLALDSGQRRARRWQELLKEQKSMTNQIEADLRDALARRAAQVPPEAETRLREVAYDPRSPWLGGRALPTWRQVISRDRRQGARVRRPLVLRAASAAGALVAGTVAVIVFTAGQTPNAFAGWSADPTAAGRSQIQSAEAECERNPRFSSLKPVLADVRGTYTLLVYGSQSGGVCITGPAFEGKVNDTSALPFDFLGTSSPTPVAAGAMQNVFVGISTADPKIPSTSFRYDVGRVSADVTAVTLVLENGNRVGATTTNGWFAAWWPAGDGTVARTAEIASKSGTSLQQLVPAGA